MNCRFSCVLAVLLIGACAPEPVPPPKYPTEAVPPQERDEEETRKLAVEKPEQPGASRPPEVDRDLGQAPPGTFKTSEGNKVDVSSLTEGRGAIIVFYRGHWCKYCRVQLEELQAAKDELAARGFDIHAVSTDQPEKAKELKKKLGLDFELYSDVGGLASQAWGVYSPELDLARPSVFVVAPGGEIVYRFVSDTPEDRPTIPTLLEAAEKARPAEEPRDTP